MKRNPRPRKYESAAARQAAYKARAEMLEFRAEPKTAATLTSIAQELDVSRSELLLSMVKFALTNHDWARFGLTHKTLPYYQGNPIMATKKASPAQLAARKKFAEMARSGAFKKAKRADDRDKNPMNMYTVLYRGTSNIAGQLMASSPKQAKEKIAEKLGLATTAYLMATKSSQVKINPAKKGLYSNIDAKRKRIAAGSGEKMRKPGTPGAPTDKSFRDAAKTAKRNPAKKTVSQKISQLMHEGYPQKQAVAVALSEQRANKVKSNPMGEKFVVGKYYETRSIGDQNIKIGATILSRTDKTVKVKGTDNLMKSSYRLSMDYDGNEIFYPWGRYSMSPMIGADDMKAKSNPVKSGKKTTSTNPIKRSSSSAVVPNPRAKKPQKFYKVSIMQEGLHKNWMGLANFYTFAEAENYAHYLSKQHKNWTIRVHDTRAMK